jgi:YVTN family beta-propeller protein
MRKAVLVIPSKCINPMVVILACLVLSSPGFSAPEDTLLYVANSKSNNVSVIDLATQKVIREIITGDHVHGVALTPDGRRLFTTSEIDHTLITSDVETGKIIGTVKLPGKPNQVAVTPDGRYVTVPIRDGDSVAIVDVGQQKIVKVLPLKEPHNSVNTGSNRYMYVSSMGANEIAVIDLEKMDYSAHIPVGGRPRPYVVSKDGRTVYTAVSYLHGFNIVDIPGEKAIQRVEMPFEHAPPRPRPYESADTYTHGIAFNPEETELWVTSMLDDCIYIYDLKTKKFTGRVATGEGPNWIVFTPDGKLACVSNIENDDVSIYNVKEHREVSRVKVGKVPKRIAIAVSVLPVARAAQAVAGPSPAN